MDVEHIWDITSPSVNFNQHSYPAPALQSTVVDISAPKEFIVKQQMTISKAEINSSSTYKIFNIHLVHLLPTVFNILLQ